MQPRACATIEELQEETLEILVSVLIVSHNCEDALRTCLQSLEGSPDRAQFEILVVDNASVDGCESIDHEFPEINMLRLPHHCGMTKARNIGLRTAKGDYILFLSPDVEVDPGVVTKLVARLQAETTSLAVCPTVVDENGAVVSVKRSLPTAAQVSACWQDPWSLPASENFELHDGKALLLRKHTLQGINYFDARYGEFWGDVDLAFQIRRAGKKILLLDDLRARQQPGATLWKPQSARDRAAFAADAANGAAAYIGKHFSFAAGLWLRIKLSLVALVNTVTFQDFGYSSSLFSRLSGGYKIDGSSQNL